MQIILGTLLFIVLYPFSLLPEPIRRPISALVKWTVVWAWGLFSLTACGAGTATVVKALFPWLAAHAPSELLVILGLPLWFSTFKGAEGLFRWAKGQKPIRCDACGFSYFAE